MLITYVNGEFRTPVTVRVYKQKKWHVLVYAGGRLASGQHSHYRHDAIQRAFEHLGVSFVDEISSEDDVKNTMLAVCIAYNPTVSESEMYIHRASP